jgi:hypothetical protein
MVMKENEVDKKTYQTPKLIEYGDVRTITQTADNLGPADGPAGGSMDKT